MSQSNLGTSTPNTWCPGCGNFAILNGIKKVLNELSQDVCPPENFVLLSGIGCHGKIVDYVNVNSFYSIHGRSIPVAEGIKMANSGLKVICFAGDGDAYGEGLEHLIFAAKRNIDITVIIHNNRLYSLTAFQYSPTSELGFKGRSTPNGSLELPLNPLELMLASQATYLARCTSKGMDLMTRLFKEAIMHKGFALVDVLQVCVTFNNLYEYYAKRVYELENHDPGDFQAAFNATREWDYNSDSRIPLGVFYKKEAPTFDEKMITPPVVLQSRDGKMKQFLSKRM